MLAVVCLAILPTHILCKSISNLTRLSLLCPKNNQMAFSMNPVSQFEQFDFFVFVCTRQCSQTKLEYFILLCILCNILLFSLALTETKMINWSKAPWWDPKKQNKLFWGLTIHLADVRTMGTKQRTDGMWLMNLSSNRRIWKTYSTNSREVK